MPDKILANYFTQEATLTPFGKGLINTTWKVSSGNREFILQRINRDVFKDPEKIAENISRIARYLRNKFPGYLFVSPVSTLDGKTLVKTAAGDYYRLFPFVSGSHTLDVVENKEQAYEAARQFGLFTRLLADFPVEDLELTLPDFHQLSFRYQQFETAVTTGNPKRIAQAKELIGFLQSEKGIVEAYEKILQLPAFKLRVTHHDTKISNVLFGDTDKGLCVIDLDTVMPGYFFSDVGDMLRTYLCPVSEEETDFSGIEIREDIFEAIVRGYLAEMKNELSAEEKKAFVFAGKFMIYMQALRFLTDYLNNDPYYGSRYEGQNYFRSGNQAALLKALIRKASQLERKVASILDAG